MKKLLPLILIVTLFSCKKQEYDVVIRGGTVYDGSGNAPVVTDVGINADTLAIIGDLSGAKGKKEIDATTGARRVRRIHVALGIAIVLAIGGVLYYRKPPALPRERPAHPPPEPHPRPVQAPLPPLPHPLPPGPPLRGRPSGPRSRRPSDSCRGSRPARPRAR